LSFVSIKCIKFVKQEGLIDKRIDYFLGKSEWSVEQVRKKKLELILNGVKEEEIMVIIDETGDRKKERAGKILSIIYDYLFNHYVTSICLNLG
jgi:SRSO17 transposase